MNVIAWMVLAAGAAGSAAATAAALPAPGASGASGGAASVVSPSVERERIGRERAEAQAAFTKREAECQQQFVVTPCVDAARKIERDVLTRLRRQEVLLDEQARRQRAAERTRAIRDSISADEARRRADAAAAVSAGASAPMERGELAETPSRTERARRESVLPAAPDRTGDAVRRAREQEQIDRQEAQQRAIVAHREAVEARNAQRAASGKPPSAPLPVPSGAAR